jgi:hypothetical protein
MKQAFHPVVLPQLAMPLQIYPEKIKKNDKQETMVFSWTAFTV